MKYFFWFSILLLAIIVATFIFWPWAMDANIRQNEPLMVDDTARSYRLVIPRSLPQPAPIVFAFHGMGDSTETMADYSRLDQLASQNGFILVYPAARNGMWATADVNSDALDTNSDVRFFDQLLRHLADHYNVDQNRVYAIGMSNGGTFAQLLANARSNEIAAVAAHSGPKPADLNPAGRRFPIMLLVGAVDPVSPTMQSDADQYRADGHEVQFISVPKLAHEWSTRHNSEIWEFLSQHPKQ
jgi:poly(3-hydroxybutyrate) depolymerase